MFELKAIEMIAQNLKAAVDNGKRYVTACLKAMLDLGHGSGPMNHGALILK
jgi:hydroxymethylpyrimidine/phosphomethylpyrimidine kinase